MTYTINQALMKWEGKKAADQAGRQPVEEKEEKDREISQKIGQNVFQAIQSQEVV